jgi:hypothetical protein
MPFSTYNEAVIELRRHINDIPQLNTLDREIENTDDELDDYIKSALNDINLNYEPKTMFTLADIVVEPGIDAGRLPWSTVRLGAILQMLSIKGIISARNTITYSDAGGVQVSEMDKWGRYLNYFNSLTLRYEKQVTQLKIRANIESVFGGVNSPMGWDYYYG